MRLSDTVFAGYWAVASASMLPRMSTLSRHLDKIRAMRISDLPAVSAASGVGLQTLREIKYGRRGRPLQPRLDTLEKLAAYFKGKR